MHKRIIQQPENNEQNAIVGLYLSIITLNVLTKFFNEKTESD